MKLIVLLTLCLCFANSDTVLHAQSPSLLTQVAGVGIDIPQLGKTPVAMPSLQGSQTETDRTAALKSIAGGAGWKRFSRNSVVAPVSIDMDYLKDASGTRLGHSVHFAFVVHASLETLKDKDLMKQMFGEEQSEAQKPDEEAKEMESQEVTDADLAKLEITPDDQTSFASVGFPLLDKVQLRGVLQLQQAVENDTIVLTMAVDPRFQDRNAWSPLSDGQRPTDWRPYQGAAGYLSVTRLNESDGKGLSAACLLESRFVIYEPVDWFSGSNLLRSKLPLMLQESARSLRRKLK